MAKVRRRRVSDWKFKGIGFGGNRGFSQTGSARRDGRVLVKEKVLLLAFTGFAREQKCDLSTLVRSVLEDVLLANRAGFFH